MALGPLPFVSWYAYSRILWLFQANPLGLDHDVLRICVSLISVVAERQLV